MASGDFFLQLWGGNYSRYTSEKYDYQGEGYRKMVEIFGQIIG